WWKYVYDEHYDCVLCPEFQVLTYRTTNRDGYREYKSDPKICIHCPTRHLCTCSKDCVKTVQRHIWKDYEELADDARYTPKYQELYKRRKETIERVFADAKEKHAMRYTQYRGLAQVTNWVKLKFAAMNLKKLATWLWREKLFPFISILLCTLYDRTRPTHNPYTGFLDRLTPEIFGFQVFFCCTAPRHGWSQMLRPKRAISAGRPKRTAWFFSRLLL
ncbi:MAG TPA: transposase, partial [Candidatus Caccousia avistercoris]|nr:transposase [Candidatus Caccousia avistercoris]